MFHIFTVALFGHRTISEVIPIERKINEIVHQLINDKTYVDFLVGRDGDFDVIASSVIHRVKKQSFSANSSLVWIMPYETEEWRNNTDYYENYYDEIELCHESASSHFKGAIQKRNRYMVDRADLIVCFVKNKGGAYKTMQYALKKGKKVINLYEV